MGIEKKRRPRLQGQPLFFFSAFLLVDPKNEFQENEFFVLRQRRWDI